MAVEPMTDITTASGVSEALLDHLRTSLRGEVIDSQHPDYDTARSIWNGLIDRRPGAIARCAGVADVVAAVNLAREHRPVVSIRGGGHQVAGSAVCDDGLVIDLSRMRGVWVEPESRTAWVHAGATWGDLDHETQLHGLMTPGGEVSTTGVAGFTLGGGMGVTMRKHGLACDNLRSVQIVTADGEVRTASRDEHPELFWAARGGGRGIGVVTGFEFGLHPLGPQVAAMMTFYPYDQAREVARAWRDLAHDAPETLAPQLVLWSVPPDPAIPAELHGQKVVISAGLYAGPADEAGPTLAPFRQLGTPLLDATDTVPYVAAQSALDELLPTGGRYYMKSHFLDQLSDDAIDTLLAVDADRPTPETLTAIRTLGGAVDRIDGDESAYAHRGARFNLSIDACWADPGLDQQAIGWSREAWERLRPFATGGVYVNFSGLDDDTDDLYDAAFGASQRRLEQVRRTYDPDRLFEGAARRS
jgi:FAD/FMN-containing dehydrogenase